MRLWSKCVIFSRKWKSSISVGPRSPALSESSVCGMRTPWLVARTSSSGRAWNWWSCGSFSSAGGGCPLRVGLLRWLVAMVRLLSAAAVRRGLRAGANRLAARRPVLGFLHAVPCRDQTLRPPELVDAAEDLALFVGDVAHERVGDLSYAHAPFGRPCCELSRFGDE